MSVSKDVTELVTNTQELRRQGPTRTHSRDCSTAGRVKESSCIGASGMHPCTGKAYALILGDIDEFQADQRQFWA